MPLSAQMMGPRTPTLSGIWHPVVGTGAAYDVTHPDGTKSQLEITIVGKEDVEGKAAYWLEMAMISPHSDGQMYMKNLMSVSEAGLTSSRRIMQMAGQDPMEMDSMMGARRGQTPTPTDIREKSELIGNESITVPAGAFSCQHYRAKDGSADTWISDRVSPWGLVKSQGKEATMVLTKVITDATDHITGTPKKFDPTQMMRNRTGNQGQ